MTSSIRRNARLVGLGTGARSREEAVGLRTRALFDDFAPMVLAVCRYHLRDPQAAEDAAQETSSSGSSPSLPPTTTHAASR